ncbi:hypothetical protein LINPERHAP2_LOCUS36862 [Linum perenne]
MVVSYSRTLTATATRPTSTWLIRTSSLYPS